MYQQNDSKSLGLQSPDLIPIQIYYTYVTRLSKGVLNKNFSKTLWVNYFEYL